MFVCLFVVNAKTTAHIDAKRSGITKNDPESVLHGLNSPVLVLARLGDIATFLVFHHVPQPFYLSLFYFQLLPGLLLTQSSFAKMMPTARHITTDSLSLMKPSHLEWKCYCIDKFMYMQACLASSIFICMHALHAVTLKHCQIVAWPYFSCPTLLFLSDSCSFNYYGSVNETFSSALTKVT